VNHPLERLKAIEVLLLLEQMDIGRYGYATRSLTVGRVRKRDSFIVRKVRRIILSLPCTLNAGDFSCSSCRAIVGALEQ
jgi:hypothetical protein